LRVCHSFDVTAQRQDVARISFIVVWQAYSQLTYAAHNPATAVAKAGKFLPFLRKIFNDDPQFFCTFSVEPLVIYNCALYKWKLSHRLRDIRLLSIQWPWNPS